MDREPSRLFRDLLELENAFRYNLALLKVRDEEIERCTTTNRALQSSLKSALRDIDALNAAVANLEGALRARERRDRIRQSEIERMTGSAAALERERRELDEDHRRRVAEQEERFRRRLGEKEEEAKRAILQEHRNYNKIKCELQNILNENFSLRNNLRDLQSQHALLTSEVKTSKSTISNLNSEVARSNQELAALRRNHEQILLENANFRQKIQDLIEEQRRTCSEIDEVKRELEKCNEEKRGLMDRVGGLGCGVPEHENFEGVKRQNAVLQEVVKAMRKERNGDVEDIKDAEERLSHLEMLIDSIKNNPVT